MIAEISSLISSSKAAYDIAMGISALKSDVERNERLSETLSILISIKKDALSVLDLCEKLQKEKDAITKKIVELEDWSKTKIQYELKELAPGVFVYSCKVTNDPTKPMHWLCTKCFSEKKAHIIQFIEESRVGKHYFCPACNTKYDIHNDYPRSHSSRHMSA